MAVLTARALRLRTCVPALRLNRRNVRDYECVMARETCAAVTGHPEFEGHAMQIPGLYCEIFDMGEGTLHPRKEELAARNGKGIFVY